MKKILQKSLSTLLMLVAMFAVSISAMAEDKVVTFQYDDETVYSNGGAAYTGETVDGVTVTATTFVERNDWGTVGIYASSNASMTITSETTIKSITLTNQGYGYGSYYANNWVFTNVDSYTGAGSNTLVITPVEGSCSVSIEFKWSGSNIRQMQVVVEDAPVPTEDIDYTLTVVGEVPAGASVTLDGESFTESGTHSVMKNLTIADLVVVDPAGYYSETSYDKDSHTFTVQFKHWYVYNVTVTGHAMGALSYASSYYESGQTIQSKTTIADSEFTAYDLNGYDESVSVTAVDEYNYNVKVTYTESAAIDYNIVLVGAPAGASVTVNNDQTFTENGIYTTNYTLQASNISCNVPAGYEAEVEYNEGTHTFTVTFTKPSYITVDFTQTNNYNSNGVSVSTGASVSTSGVNLYYNSYSIDVTTDVNIVKIVFNGLRPYYSNGSSAIAVVSGGGSWQDGNNSSSPATWLAPADCKSVSFTNANNADFYVGSIQIYLADENAEPEPEPEPTPAPEFPVEGVAYQIGLYNSVIYPAGGYLNVVTTNGNNGTIRADEAEPLYFTWDGAEGAFYIQDEEGNYIGGATGSNTWSCMPTVKEYWTVETISEGVYAFKSKTSGYLGFNTATNGAFRDMQKGGYKAESGYYHEYSFTIEEYTVAPVSVATFDMSAAGWATLCIDKDFTVPEGYTAYTVGEDVDGVAVLEKGGQIVLTEITDVLAGTAVILEGAEATGVELFAPASTPAEPEVNFLLGTYSSQVFEASVVATYYPSYAMDSNYDFIYEPFGACQLYQLANEDNVVGFYRQVADGSTLECGANKAFLVVPAEAASNARFALPGQNATGINAIATEKAEVIYNLQGQRVNVAKAGVYVKNGKKMIVK